MSRLSKYLLNRELPADARSFVDGVNQDLCIFCASPHDRITLNFRDHFSGNYSYKRLGTGIAHLCRQCDKTIKLLKDRGFTYTSRIEKYSKTGLFPVEIYEYVMGEIHQSRCVFCNTKVIEGMRDDFTSKDVKYSVLNIPIPSTTSEYPSNVLVCELCTLELAQYPKIKLVNDYCPWCHQAYPLTIQVYTTRKKNDTLGKHVCGSCWYSRLNNKYNVKHIVDVECGVCEKKYTQDITQVIDPVIGYASAAYNRAYCREHRALSVVPDKEYIYKTRVVNIYIRVIKSLRGAYFEILEFDHAKDFEPELLYASPHRPGEPSEVIPKAHEKLSEIMEAKASSKLQLNDR